MLAVLLILNKVSLGLIIKPFKLSNVFLFLFNNYVLQFDIDYLNNSYILHCLNNINLL